MLQYREHKVGDTLAAYIKKLWILDNSINPSAVCGKTVLPNGCFNIAVVDGEGALVTTGKTSFTLVQGVYFCGQMTKAVSVDIKSHTKISLIQLHPWTPASFTAIDMSQFKDAIVELTNVSGFLAELRPGSSFTDEVALKRLLQDRLLGFKKDMAEDALIRESCQEVLCAHGHLSVKEVACRAGVSERLLQKRFKHTVGLSPKEYLKIIKLREAVDQLAYPEADCPSGTAVAVDSAYYDQAHFIHTFQKIIKTTPKKFSPDAYLLSFKEKQ